MAGLALDWCDFWGLSLNTGVKFGFYALKLHGSLSQGRPVQIFWFNSNGSGQNDQHLKTSKMEQKLFFLAMFKPWYFWLQSSELNEICWTGWFCQGLKSSLYTQQWPNLIPVLSDSSQKSHQSRDKPAILETSTVLYYDHFDHVPKKRRYTYRDFGSNDSSFSLGFQKYHT